MGSAPWRGTAGEHRGKWGDSSIQMGGEGHGSGRGEATQAETEVSKGPEGGHSGDALGHPSSFLS